MKYLRYTGAFLVVAAAAFHAGRWSEQRPASALESPALYYYCPMHPAYRSHRPGDAPCCGMRLEAMFRTGKGASAPGPGAVAGFAEKVTRAGIRTEAPVSIGGVESIRVPGRVAADERLIYRLNTAAAGWVRSVFANTAGSIVERDEPLASFYARELLTSQQSYIFALTTLDNHLRNRAHEAQLASTRNQVQATGDALRSFGMSETQLAEIARTRRVADEIVLRSPVRGLILRRNVSVGQRFASGEELYVVADIGRVWIIADVYARDVARTAPGRHAIVTLPDGPRTMAGRVSQVLPQYDLTNRTYKVRLEVDNSDNTLRPDMFVQVEFKARLPEGLTVPADALVHSGRGKIVYVADDQGFHPRVVETGWRTADRVQIVKGLQAGERVVVSGTFLVDSETRMRTTNASAAETQASTSAETDPVCGMTAKPDWASVQHGGRTYRFCSATCKRQFEASPEKFLAALR